MIVTAQYIRTEDLAIFLFIFTYYIACNIIFIQTLIKTVFILVSKNILMERSCIDTLVILIYLQ